MSSFSDHRLARRVIEASEKISKSKTAADVLGATRLNLIGLGLTLVGPAGKAPQESLRVAGIGI